MRLRRFNEAGLEKFKLYVLSLKQDKTLPAPLELLEDDAYTRVVEPKVDAPDAEFANRLDAAIYLDDLFSRAQIGYEVLNDVHLWAWLSLRFFDQVRPLGDRLKAVGGNLKKLGTDLRRFVPSPMHDYETYYRHLLRHPLQVYWHVDRHPELAMCFLIQPVHQPGDIVEQLASRITYYRNKEIMAAITALFVDPAGPSVKPKASSKARRLHNVLEQFDCTWDLGYIAKELLVPMLPVEFNSFKPDQQRAA